MGTKNAYLSGKNRLTCNQAKIVCELFDGYFEEEIHELSDADYQLNTIITTLRSGIHEGRLANLSGDNKLTVEEVSILLNKLRALSYKIQPLRGHDRKSIERAVVILNKSKWGKRPELSGRNRWGVIDETMDDADEETNASGDLPF